MSAKVGENLKLLKLQENLTQEALGRKLHISRSALAHYESEIANLSTRSKK